MRERPIIPRHLRIFAPGPEWNGTTENKRLKNRFVNPVARRWIPLYTYACVSRPEEKILYDRSNSLEIWRKKKEGNYEVIDDESNDR